jgi:hypothetical protein
MDLSKLSDADLVALHRGDLSKVSDVGLRMLTNSAAPTAPAPAMNVDPTEGMSTFEKLAAGAGKAVYDIGRGAGQMLGLVSDKDVAKARELDAPLMKTGAGMAGNIGGNILASLPALAIPGAQGVAGAALTGAGMAALQPTTADESRLKNMALGGAMGAALPAAVSGLKAAKAALYDPLAGQERIIGGALNRAAGSDAATLAQALRGNSAATPGVRLSAGQVGGSEGLSALEDAITSALPSGELARAGRSNRAALADALRGVAKTPEDMAAAIDAREEAAKALYGKAFQSDAMRKSVANDTTQAATGLYNAGGAVQDASLSTPGIRALMDRPTFKDAYKFARQMMEDQGVPVPGQSVIKVPGYGGTSVTKSVPVSKMDAAGMPITSMEDMSLNLPGSKGFSIASGEAGPTTLQELHYVKLALDKMKNPNAATSAERVQNAAVDNISSALTKELEKVSPLYSNARQTFTQMSQPINQMQVGQSLAQKLIPATAGDIPESLNYASLAKAMQNPDRLAQQATGFSGAKMANVLSPEQLATVQGVTSDASQIAEALKRGMGTGSPTARRLAGGEMLAQHFAQEAPITSKLLSMAGNIPGVGAVGKGISLAASTVGNKVQSQMLGKLDDMLANNPAQVAKLIESELSRIEPSARQQIIRALPQQVAASLPASFLSSVAATNAAQ